MSEASHTREIRPLTGIRGIAAFWVLGYHFIVMLGVLAPGLRTALAPLLDRGFEGVDLFFLLSGFILSYVYPPAETLTLRKYGNFLWFRLARIYPNHLATLLFLVALVSFARWRGIPITGQYDFATLPSHLLLLHCWPGFQNFQWNGVSWSISAEWFAYLAIFPLAQRLLTCGRLRGLELLGVYLLLGSWLLLARSLGREAQSLSRVSLEFLAGSLLFALRERNAWPAASCQRFLLPLILLACTVPWWLPRECASDWLVLLMPLILLGATSESSLPARLLSTPPALFFGRISYAIYMVHVIAEQCLARLLPVAHFAASSLPVRLAVLACYVFGVIAAAAALHYIIEVPARNACRRLHNRRPQKASSRG